MYVEKPGAASLCSSDDEESEVDEQELAERRMLERIISELRQAVVARMNSVCDSVMTNRS